MLHDLLNSVPAWVPQGARYAIDFTKTQVWNGNLWLGQASAAGPRTGAIMVGGAAVATANTAFCPDYTGKLQTFPLNAARITQGMGLWVEKTTTNRVWPSRNMNHANWVISNSTDITATQTGATGADGTANSATQLTCNVNNGTILMAVTLASTQMVGSAYVQRITGTGTVWMTIDGGSNWTDITSYIGASGTYGFAYVANQTIANPSYGFKMGTAGDVILVDMNQLENSDYPTTRLLTTTAVRSRAGGGSDEPTFGTTGSSFNDGLRLINSTLNQPMSVFCVWVGNGASNAVIKGGGDGANSTNKMTGGQGQAITFGTDNVGTVAVTSNTCAASDPTVANGGGTINKAAGSIDGGGCAVCLNGGTVVTNTSHSTTGTTNTHNGIGNNGAGTLYLGGRMLFIAIWDYKISQSQMISLTTAFNGW